MALSTTAVTGTVRLDGFPVTATYTAVPVGLPSAPFSGALVPGSKSGTASSGVLSFNLDRAVTPDTWMPAAGVTYLVTVTWQGKTWTTHVTVRPWTTAVDLGYIDFERSVATDWERVNDLSVGESTLSRIGLVTGDTAVSGTLYLQYFTAQKTELCSRMNVPTANGAAAATPTTCLVGLYAEAANGDLFRLGVSTNDTAMWAAANTEYIKTIASDPFLKYRGQRYAAAMLVVTGQTAPAMLSWKPTNSAGHHALLAKAPRITGLLTSQTGLPTSIAAGNVAASAAARPFYAELLPPA